MARSDGTLGGEKARLDAIVGKVTPDKRMMRESVALLRSKILRQQKLRADSLERHSRIMKDLAKSLPPDMRKPSAAEVAAAKALRASLSSERTRRRPTPLSVAPIRPRVQSGSVLIFDPPPYSHGWGDGRDFSSDVTAGNFYAHSNRNSWSAAGVYLFARPLRDNIWMRFAPFYSVAWDAHASVYTSWYSVLTLSRSTADANVSIGAYVEKYDGQRWTEIADERMNLWSGHALTNDPPADSTDSRTVGSLQVLIPPGRATDIYAMFAWGLVETQEHSGWGFSYGSAWATLSAHIPWIVVEQYV